MVDGVVAPSADEVRPGDPRNILTGAQLSEREAAGAGRDAVPARIQLVAS